MLGKILVPDFKFGGNDKIELISHKSVEAPCKSETYDDVRKSDYQSVS